MKEWNSTYQLHYSVSNAKNLSIPYVEANKSVTNVEKRTHPIIKMNAEQKRDIQIVMRTTLHSLKHVACITCQKKEKDIMQVQYKRNISFPDARKSVESYMGTQSYASILQKTNLIQ